MLRAGTGFYYLPTNETGQTTGFTATTSAITTTPDFRPRPRCRIRFRTVWQYSAGFEYQLWHCFPLEVTYVGSRTNKLQVGPSLDYLTTDQLALGTAYLNTNVPNPFFGLLPVNTTLGAQPTIQRRCVAALPAVQRAHHEREQLGLELVQLGPAAPGTAIPQRFGMLASYTKSKTMEAVSYKNAQDLQLSRELTSFDVPQVLNVSGIYEFPVGPGRKFRFSAFNITNTPIFGSANTSPTSPLFGSISKAQINLPRECEIALRYRF